jgi:hypothetical protein
MKTTGILRDDGGKDYLISHNGEQHKATKSGSLFSCNGVTDTLRTIKQMIESGAMPPTVDSQSVQVPDHEPDLGTGLWDCVHPCALLVLTVGERGIDDEMRKHFVSTLNNYGWLLECGSPDYERAMRDYQLHQGSPYESLND